MDWKLVRGNLKGLNWNGIIRSSFSLSSLNEALLRVIRDTFPRRTIVIRTDDKPCFDESWSAGL